MVNAFPAAWLRDEERDILPQDQVQILEPIDQAQDWESFLVNGIAVRPPYRRQGLGKRLVEWAIEQARAGGFARLSANVWEDNLAARALFEQCFDIQKPSQVAAAPRAESRGRQLVDGAVRLGYRRPPLPPRKGHCGFWPVS